MGKQKTKDIILECVAMIALAFALSNVPIIKMPYGGNVTAASMLPIIILSYRQGLKWGLPSAFIYSGLQLLMGLDHLQEAEGTIQLLEIIFLDYIFAFTVLGIMGWWRRERPQTTTLIFGAAFVCFLRFVCHVFAGATVWSGVSIPCSDGMLNSVIYNLAYMIPETVVTVYAITLISLSTNLRLNKPEFVQKKLTTAAMLYSLLVMGIAIVADFIYLFGKIQDKDGFDISLIKSANPMVLGLITASGMIVSIVIFFLITVFVDNKNTEYN